MKCGTCIHFDVCYVPRTTGCVEQCKNYKECPQMRQQTNFEFMQTCTKEEMEKTLTILVMQNRMYGDKELAYFNERFKIHRWLKGVHTP